MRRLHEALQAKFRRKVPLKTVRLIDPQVDESDVLGSLLPFLDAQYQAGPMLFHLDVTSSVGVLGFQLSGRPHGDRCGSSPQQKRSLHSVDVLSWCFRERQRKVLRVGRTGLVLCKHRKPV